MPLDTYANLQKSIADWLARPDDPLLTPTIPDMITMFEEMARNRLQTRFVEKQVTVTPTPHNSVIPLPLDYAQMREVWIDTNHGRRVFSYQTPANMDHNLWYTPGHPAAYTIEGLSMRITGDPGDAPDPINLSYLTGITSLSNAVPTNWLLDEYPSAYLFGSLAMAAPFIGDDSRIAVWMAGREERIEDIRLADRKAKYPHGLVIQTDTKNP